MLKKNLALLASLTLLLAGSSAAFASGFAIIEQSVSGLGNAYAGGAASAEDATTIFFNPAGMTRLDKTEAIAAMHIIVPSAKFKNNGSTHATTAPLTGNNGGDASNAALVPNLYITTPIADRLTFGLGINAPFGLVTEYNDSWVGRYHALKSDLRTVNINPSFAFKSSDNLSLGFGVTAMKVDVELSQMIDFGLIGATFMVPGSIPQGQDGKVILDADDWAYGWNIGALYEFNQGTRLGVAYRSRVFVEVDGSADFIDVPVALSGSFFDTGVSGKITLPATVSVSAYHKATDKLAVMADITWTEWSSFTDLVFDFSDPAVADSTTPENWDDTWRYSVGVSYDLNRSLVLRGGLAYDETPMADNYRTPRIPGADRYWISFGAGIQLSKAVVVDLAYTHLFVDDSKINLVSADNASKGYLTGEYENQVDIASASVSYRF